MLERLLIVGLGSIGSRHARLARDLMPNAQIAALRHQGSLDLPDVDVDLCFSTLEEALQFRPQAAVIANPAPFHLDVAYPLAEADVHLLVEKPLSTACQGVFELVSLCRTRGTVLMTGYNLRFLPSLQRFRELLKADQIGRILYVRADVGQHLLNWRPNTDYRQTVSAKAALGGGVLLELSHEIDYLRWLFGEVKWVSACLRKHSSLEIDVEDTAHLILEFVGEEEAAPVTATLNMDFLRHDTTRNCTVVGEAGSLRWNALTGTIEQFLAGDLEWQTIYRYQHDRDESYLSEWRHFLDCVKDGAAPLTSGDDGLAVLRIVEAARHSSATGTVAQVKNGAAGSTNGQ